MPSRPPNVAGATVVPTPGGPGLIFTASAPAGDALHKSIPMLTFAAGTEETTEFPGTDA